MIKAVIFDLDGTLVETETLKGQSYAKALKELSNGKIAESEVMSIFGEVVGRSREEVAEYLLRHFNIFDAARQRLDEFSVSEPWEVLVDVRLKKYLNMVKDPALMEKHLCPDMMALLKDVKSNGFRTGLATMSQLEEAHTVLCELKMEQYFDFIATRENVVKGKPDPEIYLLEARELEISPDEGLVMEDSLVGIEAGLRAGMSVIAVPSDYTRRAVRESKVLDERWIVDDSRNLNGIVQNLMREKNFEQGAKLWK